MEALWQEIQHLAQAYGGRIAGALVILIVGLIALRYLVAPFRRMLERSRLEPATASFLANSARALLLVAMVISILQQLGMETASLVTVLAAAGLAIALSLQNMLSNLTAGLVLLSFRMIRVGDVIDVNSMRGRVTDIFPFHILLVTEDNQTLTVPNALLLANGFRNASALPERRVQWTLPLGASENLEAAKAALRTRLLEDVRILRQPPPRFFVQEWTADKRILAVHAWTTAADCQAVQEELLEALGQALTGGKP